MSDYKLIINNQIVDISPELIAELYAEMDSEGQARFYNCLSIISTPWLTTQLQYITDEDGLTLGGRRVMQYIGEYSHWGLVQLKKGSQK